MTSSERCWSPIPARAGAHGALSWGSIARPTSGSRNFLCQAPDKTVMPMGSPFSATSATLWSIARRTETFHDDGAFASYREYFSGRIPFAELAKEKRAVAAHLGVQPLRGRAQASRVRHAAGCHRRSNGPAGRPRAGVPGDPCAPRHRRADARPHRSGLRRTRSAADAPQGVSRR